QPYQEYGTGAEQITRAALIQVQTQLPIQCPLIDNLWESRDRDWAALRGYPYAKTTATIPSHDSLYLGSQPSLVTGEAADFTRWPAITFRAGDKDPASDQHDH